MLVIDFQHTPFDFYYRLFGTKVVDLFGIDATAKWATELFGSKYELIDDMDYYQMLSQNLVIAYNHGSIYWQDRSHVNCSFLELPLSTDGKTITNLITILNTEVSS